MSEPIINKRQDGGKPSAADKTFEFIYALRIIASPLIVGVIGAFILYLALPGLVGIIAAIVVVCIALWLGVYWAVKAHRKYGTVNFMTRVNSVRELRSED